MSRVQTPYWQQNAMPYWQKSTETTVPYWHKQQPPTPEPPAAPNLAVRTADTFLESANDAIASLAHTATGGLMTRFVLGKEEAAKFRDTLQKRAQNRAALNERTAEQSIIPGAGLVLDAASSAGAIAPAMAGGAVAGGAKAVATTYGLMAATFAPDHFKEAKDAGKGNLAAAAHAALQTAWEVGTEAVGGKIAKRLGGKTFETMFGDGSVKSALGAVMGTAVDAGGEATTEVLQSITSAIDGVDPEALENLGPNALRAAAVGMILAGGANAVPLVAEKVSQFVSNPTPENAKAAGIPDDMAADDAARQELADQLVIATPVPENGAPSSPANATGAGSATLDPSGQTPSQTAPQSPTEDAPKFDGNFEPVFAAKRAFTDDVRSRMGFEEIPTPETVGWARNLLNARKQGIPGRALHLADAIIAKPRALTSDETAGMVIKGAELSTAYNTKAQELKSVTDPDDIKLRAAELNELETQLETVTRALRTSGTEKGRNLAIQKLAINDNWDLATNMVRAKAAKGDALTDADRAAITAKTEKYEAAQAKVKEIEQKIERETKDKAHREVRRLTNAVKSIRARIGLEPAKLDTDVPGLSADDKAKIIELNDKLAEAEKALATLEKLPPQERVHHRPSEEIVSDMDDAISRVRSELNRKAKVVDSSKDEARRIKALEKSLAKAQEQLALAKRGEIPAPAGRRMDVMSKERDKLHYELQRTRQEIKDTISGLKPKTIGTRIQGAQDAVVALMTSIDVSAVLRQGGFLVAGHPILAAKRIPDMFRAFSDAHSWKIEHELFSRPQAREYEQVGLAVTRSDIVPEGREELYASGFFEKMERQANSQLVRGLASAVAGSGRAYRTYLNLIRADAYDLLTHTHGGAKGLSLKQKQDIAFGINVATGRGGIAALDKHMRSASTVLWAPRLMLSRFQYQLGVPLWRTDNQVRMILGAEYLRTFVGMTAWYGMYAAAFGDDPRFSIGLDPRAGNFGKVSVGNVTIDPLAGLAQTTRFTARMISQQTVKDGRVKKLSGWELFRTGADFYRSKASPMAGTLINVATREDYGGNNTNIATVEGAYNLATSFVPLSLQEWDKLVEEAGVPKAIAFKSLEMFGHGVQVYDKKK